MFVVLFIFTLAGDNFICFSLFVCLFCFVLFCFGVRSSLILFVTLFTVTTPYGVHILLGLLSGITSFIYLFVNSWPMLFIVLL